MDVTPSQLKNIKREMRIAWLAGLVSTFTIVIYAYVKRTNGQLTDMHMAALLLVAALTAFLSYGVYRFSRISAILLLPLFITNEIMIWHRVPFVNEAMMSYVIMFAFILGILGTFQYQQYLKHIQPGSKLAVFRDGFVSPYYTYGVEVLDDANTPVHFIQHLLKTHFAMRQTISKQVMRLRQTHGSVVLPLETKQEAEKLTATIAAEAKAGNYPLQCNTVGTGPTSATGDDNIITRNHIEAAKRIIALTKAIHTNKHTLVPVKEDEIQQLDLTGYQQFRAEMEAADFRYLGDIEIPELSRVPNAGIARTMTRYMLSTQGDIIATYFQAKPLTAQLLKRLLRGLLNGRIIAAPHHFISSLKPKQNTTFTTEFSDGRFLITSTMSSATKLSNPKSIETIIRPIGTPLPDLLQAHQQRLTDYRQDKAHPAQPVVMHSLADIATSYEHYRAQIAAYRAKNNWITEAELQRLSNGNIKLASAIYAEVQKLIKEGE